MLEELRIRSLGVIDDAVLELGPGLTAVTGETGAGKTMVVTALGLLLGARADAGIVRTGARAAVVEGRLAVAAQVPAAQRAAQRAVERAVDAGAELDDDALLVSRSVGAEGRSRAACGGRGVPVGVLAEVCGGLVVVHGQSDQLRLRSGTEQREVLDRFAGDAHANVLARHRAAHRRLREVEAALDEMERRRAERAAEAELLRLGLSEVEEAQPQPGEDAALRAEALRLSHAEDLRAAAAAGHGALLGDPAVAEPAPDAAALVAAARRALEAVRQHDEQLGGLADRLAEVGYLLADVAADLAAYADGVEADPARLSAVEERRAVLAALARRHGGDVDAVLAWADRASQRLLELDSDDDRGDLLRGERDELRARLVSTAARLSTTRAAAAERLQSAVAEELAALAMPSARLVVDLTQREADDGLVLPDGRRVAVGADGADDVTFLLAAHVGSPPRPLARGASGGELSRVMLALEVVLAGADPVPTMVFDEVDAGVGGRAAVEVGRRLARLAERAQVLVVTHLPQVAAFADHHLLVEKAEVDAGAVSGVVALDDAGRVRELARMLAGFEESGSATAHARELLDGAAEERAGGGRALR